MDPFSKKQRSYCMSQVKHRNTTPEKAVRKLLRDMSVKYRLDCKAPGRPDIKLTGYNILIFVDGCFWHGCRLHLRRPKSNKSFWNEKIKSNIERDIKNKRLLLKRGYQVIRIWEHETLKPMTLEKRLRRALKESGL